MEDVYAVEQGYTDTNLWLEWMKYTVHQVNRSDCYVCAGARPHLGTVPLNLDYEAELCLVSLFTNMTEGNACEEWKKRYPIVAKAFSPGKGITIYPGNYTCYNVSGQGRDMGRFRDGFCGSYSNLTHDHLINQVQSVADVFWICGDMKIRSRVEGNWTGECTLAKALMPIHIAPADHTVKENDFIAHIKINLRTRRSADDDRTSRNTPKGSFDPHVYIDAIGVPRGIPDEYKARDQVRAGFESIIPIITVNKNVDWINYIYYNQQRFVNYTRDALQGLAEQLDPTSIMAYQNRMALDMILAEKGGVCKMVGDVCCTYIPDNTGVDGKVTLAIKKLTTLSEELKKNSGVTDPWGDYFGWTSSFKGCSTLPLLKPAILALTNMYVLPPIEFNDVVRRTQNNDREKCNELGIDMEDLGAVNTLTELLEEGETARGLGPFTDLKKKSRRQPPTGDLSSIDIFIRVVEEDFSRVRYIEVPDNLTEGEREALQQLGKDQSIILKPSDKGGNLVLMDH
ncbi:syncytin-A-like [Anomaloglossus baeobatrachus]